MAIIAVVVIIIPFAEKVVDKLYPEKDDWSISDGGTFDMPIGALVSPILDCCLYVNLEVIFSVLNGRNSVNLFKLTAKIRRIVKTTFF